MNIKEIISGLQGVTKVASNLAGMGAAVGIPYAGLIKEGLSIATALEDAATEGTVVLQGEDRAQVQQLIVDLQALNDDLAKQVDAS